MPMGLENIVNDFAFKSAREGPIGENHFNILFSPMGSSLLTGLLFPFSSLFDWGNNLNP